MKIFFTRKQWERAKAKIRRDVPDPYYLITLYSENLDILRNAVAAQIGVDTKFVIERSMLTAPMGRALRQVAGDLRQIREDGRDKPDPIVRSTDMIGRAA